jgi:hypothetical protein
MRTHVRRWVLTAAMVLFAAPAAARQAEPAQAGAPAAAPALVELRLKDGSVIYGFVQTETADRVVLKTIAGAIVEVQRAQIASLQPARGQVVNGQFRPADPNATRLLFSPTARSLTRGQGYVGVYEFILPFVQVGLTNRLSMGVGTPLVFFGDDTGRPVWFTPKYQFYKGPRTSAAVGVMHFVVVGENARVGLAYAVTTTGTDDDALTVGLGWAYAHYHETVYDYSPCFSATTIGTAACAVSTRTTRTEGAPLVMVGGEHRVSRRVKVVTENYAFQHGGVLSVGARFLGERFSADLGLMAPIVGGDGFVVAPVLNVVWLFGHGTRR